VNNGVTHLLARYLFAFLFQMARASDALTVGIMQELRKDLLKAGQRVCKKCKLRVGGCQQN
jgi:hypothetical protein